MSKPFEEVLAEASDIYGRLVKGQANLQKIIEDLEHIKKPYSRGEIYELYASGNYNAELLLQHALIHLTGLFETKVKQQFKNETNIL